MHVAKDRLARMVEGKRPYSKPRRG